MGTVECPSCRNAVEEELQFCPACGAVVGDVSTQTGGILDDDGTAGRTARLGPGDEQAGDAAAADEGRRAILFSRFELIMGILGEAAQRATSAKAFSMELGKCLCG